MGTEGDMRKLRADPKQELNFRTGDEEVETLLWSGESIPLGSSCNAPRSSILPSLNLPRGFGVGANSTV